MAAQTPAQRLVEAICTHLACAIATGLGGGATITAVTAGAQAPSDGWQVRLAVEGRGKGSVSLGVGAADAIAIAKRVRKIDGEPDGPAIQDAVRELAAQAVSILMLEPIGAGLDIRVDSVEPQHAAPEGRPAAWTYFLGEGFTVVLAGWSALELTASAEADRPSPSEAPARSNAENLDLILDIDLPMSVRFGRAELALGALTRLGPGSIIDLGRAPDDPVEVLVSGRVVARGDVVVVGGNYGVRVTELVSSGVHES